MSHAAIPPPPACSASANMRPRPVLLFGASSRVEILASHCPTCRHNVQLDGRLVMSECRNAVRGRRHSSAQALLLPLMVVQGTPRRGLVALIRPSFAPGRCLHLLGQLLRAACRDKRPLTTDRDPHPLNGIEHNAPPREPGPEPACVGSRVGVVVWHGFPPTR